MERCDEKLRRVAMNQVYEAWGSVLGNRSMMNHLPWELKCLIYSTKVHVHCARVLAACIYSLIHA